MKKRYRIKNVSNKQAGINRQLATIKKDLPKICCICGGWGNQLMHLLPRSLFPEHIVDPVNLAIGCQECHSSYDDDISFRQEQLHLFERVAAMDQLGANRYFDFID